MRRIGTGAAKSIPQPPIASERLQRGTPALEVANDLARGVVAGRAGDAATGMPTRAAQVEARQRHAVVRGAEDRPRREELVEPELAVEDVAVDEAEAAFQIERR